MLYLSEVLLKGHDITSFEQLSNEIQRLAIAGEIHFSIDVKPPFPDTPNNWEEQLEIAFSSAR